MLSTPFNNMGKRYFLAFSRVTSYLSPTTIIKDIFKDYTWQIIKNFLDVYASVNAALPQFLLK